MTSQPRPERCCPWSRASRLASFPGPIALLMPPLAERLKHLQQFVHRLFALMRSRVHLFIAGPLEPALHDLSGIPLEDLPHDPELLLVGRMPLARHGGR